MMRDFNTNATCNLQQMSTLVSLSVLSGLVVKYNSQYPTCNQKKHQIPNNILFS